MSRRERWGAALVLLVAGVATGELFVWIALRIMSLLLPRPRRVTGPAVVCWLVFNALIVAASLRWFHADPASSFRLNVVIFTCVFMVPLGLVWLMYGDPGPRR